MRCDGDDLEIFGRLSTGSFHVRVVAQDLGAGGLAFTGVQNRLNRTELVQALTATPAGDGGVRLKIASGRP
jgi:hypothetical protein